jgi:hypothetical protein
MKFTGQVRVPEVDHPGVPASILVEEDQAEVLLEGESLGRWSLYDVHATRLLSSAFSLSLGDEEITFIADEPVDFAYRGVEHMAEVWATFKAMSLPRRTVAVGRSRRGASPSRIEDLRQAMLQNLDAIDASPASEPWTDRPQPQRESETERRVAKRPSEPIYRPADVDRAESPAAREPDPDVAAPPVPEPQPTSVPVTEQPPPTRPDLKPGPGLVRSRPSPDEREHETQSPPAEESVEDVFAVEEDGGEYQIEEIDVPIDTTASSLMSTHPEAPSEPPVEDHDVVEGQDHGPDAPIPDGVTGPIAPIEPVVVDLGRYEDRGEEPVETTPTAPDDEPDKEPALAAATPSGDRSGLLGAVRSAFVRNRVEHEHHFVEAPGGIGIVRQICEECGYISIGVSD